MCLCRAGLTNPDTLPLVCKVKELPPELRMEAARIAVEINPDNDPSALLLERGVSAGPMTAVRLAALTTKYWGRNGVILTVGFLDNPPADLRSRILSHMNAWGKYCNARFSESSTDPNVRISRTPDDGYWSNLGTDIKLVDNNKPTMNLDRFTMNTADSEFFRVVRHETGHTLGFPHEHQRQAVTDRIDPVKAKKYYFDKIKWSEADVVNNILKPIEPTTLKSIGEPDEHSIMCYPLPDEIMKDGKGLVGGTDIDETDQKIAATFYPKPVFWPKYREGSPGKGIAGYDLSDERDRAFAYDGDHKCRLDHIVLYRPGGGKIAIVKNENGVFRIVDQCAPGSEFSTGFHGYTLNSPADRVLAFDYDQTGCTDHLVFYRPGTGMIRIFEHDEKSYNQIYRPETPDRGIGGYDLMSTADRIIAFDYAHTGKLDHLLLYRPGTGTVWILKKDFWGKFTPVYQQGDPGDGIAGYDLKSVDDRLFAYDYDGTGRMDHLVLYRRGAGHVAIIKNENGKFRSVFDQPSGVYDFSFNDPRVRAFAYDFESNGKKDDLVAYHPLGMIGIFKRFDTRFISAFDGRDYGSGIGGYDLQGNIERGFAFDYDGSGKMDHIVFYRPGTGTIWILGKNT